MKRWLTLLPLAAGLIFADEAAPPPPSSPPPPGRPLPHGVAPTRMSPVNPSEDVEPGIGSRIPSHANREPAAGAEAQSPSPSAPIIAVPDRAIPQAYSEEHYASTWRRNPFLLETKAADGPKGPGFAEDWELKGLTRYKGQPEALLNNKKTQESHWVRTTEDKDGFKLLKATIDRDLHKSSVEVAKAGEANPATFTFPEVAAAPPTGGRPGMPGQPGAPVRQPGAPGQMPGQMPGNGIRQPGVPPQAGNGIPRMNTPKPPAGGAPGAQPNTQGRRRVLIPPTKAS